MATVKVPACPPTAEPTALEPEFGFELAFLQTLPDRGQETAGVGAVDEAMVVGQRAGSRSSGRRSTRCRIRRRSPAVA